MASTTHPRVRGTASGRGETRPASVWGVGLSGTGRGAHRGAKLPLRGCGGVSPHEHLPLQGGAGWRRRATEAHVRETGRAHPMALMRREAGPAVRGLGARYFSAPAVRPDWTWRWKIA
ncbi:conserved hypothetical protein [Streptomyces pristinaespiralis ATCC 25486]|uniref:Uncharacterized protein n=1 Tax=Streptomyces pristinaespiralis (strain ATCC 25486 / DSM 40338 / CBS 914.69 / JCM 4507 / KCC S-0507 / NBRC 13074 / NRRL 2958 / 5647) TaxID=457429 RepID=B5HCI0_STRE2|nr:conserved hypothetical protein [Streptomyces pristinaespiralis ATCC 25486]